MDGGTNIPVCINSLLLAACPIKQEEQLITTRDGTSTYNICNTYIAMETDYLRQNNDTIDTAVTESDRLKIIEWFYAVIDKCHFDRETITMATDIMDRFFFKPSDDSHKAL